MAGETISHWFGGVCSAFIVGRPPRPTDDVRTNDIRPGDYGQSAWRVIWSGGIGSWPDALDAPRIRNWGMSRFLAFFPLFSPREFLPAGGVSMRTAQGQNRGSAQTTGGNVVVLNTASRGRCQHSRPSEQAREGHKLDRGFFIEVSLFSLPVFPQCAERARHARSRPTIW